MAYLTNKMMETNKTEPSVESITEIKVRSELNQKIIYDTTILTGTCFLTETREDITSQT